MSYLPTMRRSPSAMRAKSMNAWQWAPKWKPSWDWQRQPYILMNWTSSLLKTNGLSLPRTLNFICLPKVSLYPPKVRPAIIRKMITFWMPTETEPSNWKKVRTDRFLMMIWILILTISVPQVSVWLSIWEQRTNWMMNGHSPHLCSTSVLFPGRIQLREPWVKTSLSTVLVKSP